MSVDTLGFALLAVTIAAGVVVLFELHAARCTQTPGRTVALVLMLIVLPPLGLLAASTIRLWAALQRWAGRGEARVDAEETPVL